MYYICSYSMRKKVTNFQMFPFKNKIKIAAARKQ